MNLANRLVKIRHRVVAVLGVGNAGECQHEQAENGCNKQDSATHKTSREYRSIITTLTIACVSLFTYSAHAAITFVGTPANPLVVNNTSTTAPLGGTTATGDLNLAWYGCFAASSCTLTNPLSGYTLITSQVSGAAKLYLDRKASGTADSDPAVTRSTGAAGDMFYGGGLILRGADLTTPVHASTQSATTVSALNGTFATPALTVTNNNTMVCLLVSIYSTNNLTAFGNYNPNGAGNWTVYGTTLDNSQSIKVSTRSWCLLETTATNISTSTISVTGSNAGAFVRIAMVSINAAANVFTVNPTVSTRADDYVIGGTTGGSVEVDCVAVPKDATAPSVAEVDAGTAAGGGAALAHTSATWNGADTLTLDMPANPPLISDIYCTDGTNLVTLADETITPTGYQAPIQLTATLCTSASCPVKVYNDANATDVAQNDYASWSIVTTPNSRTITPATDGNVTIASPATPESFNGYFYDVSAGANMSNANPATFYSNWANPVCSAPIIIIEDIFPGDPSDHDLSSLCADPNGGTLTWTIDTADSGVTLTTAGILQYIGVAENETGTDSVITVTNDAGLTATQSLKLLLINTLTVPDGNGVACLTYALNIAGDYNWLVPSASYTNSPTIALGNVIPPSSPTAGSEARLGSTVSFVCSLGRAAAGTSHHFGFGFGF